MISVVARFADEAASMFGGRLHDQLREAARIAYQPGLVAAVLAVVAGVAAVWFAARPAARPAVRAVPPAYAPVQVDELSVSPSEPVDITATRDPWAR